MLLLITSAELELMKEMRTKEYEKTIEWAKKYQDEYNVVWLECVSSEEPPYLKSNFPCYCSDIHNPNYRNQGANHGMALREFFNNCNVDDDFVIQITGRYHFIDDYFFNVIKKNPDYDVYAKDGGGSQYFTGCFAIKKKYMIEWLNETDWDMLDTMMINFEKSLWDFVKNKKLKSLEVDKINMDCNIFGRGNTHRLNF